MWDILRGKQIPFCDKYNISVAFLAGEVSRGTNVLEEVFISN
jgi:hypothetical protein